MPRQRDPVKGHYTKPKVETVYVQMRVWSPAIQKVVHVPNRTVIFRGYTPDEVHRLIVEAGAAAQRRAEEEAANVQKENQGQGGGGSAPGVHGSPGTGTPGTPAGSAG